MESKLKVAILGTDPKLLKSVADKINGSRPVVVSFFTDLKDFLAHTVTDKPDLSCVSVSYPHKSAARFPKVFKMALNTPVITFGEKQDAKTRKLMASATGDYKISSVINAHNLWMKIVSYQKDMEQAEYSDNSGSSSTGNNKVKVQSSATFLKGKNYEPTTVKDSGSILSSLMAELNDSNLKNEQGINHIQSGEATQYQRKAANVINSSGELANPTAGSAGGDSQSSSTSGMVGQDATGSSVTSGSVLPEDQGTGSFTTDSPGMTHTKGKNNSGPNGSNTSSNLSNEEWADGNKASNANKNNESQGPTKSSLNNQSGSDKSSTNKATTDHDSGQKAKNSQQSNDGFTGNSDQKNKDQSSDAQKNKSTAEEDFNKKKSDLKNNPDHEGNNKNRNNQPQAESDKNSNNKNKESQGNRNKQNQGQNTEKQPPKAASKSDGSSKKDQNQTPDQVAQKKPGVSNGPLKNTQKNQDRRIERASKRSAEAQQQINWLQEACEASLQENLKAKPAPASDYKTERIHAFIVELGKTKGFLLLTTSRKQAMDANLLSGLRKTILTQASQKGHSIEMSTDFVLKLDIAETNSFMDSFGDFLTMSEDKEGGRFSFSFVEREQVRPAFEDSDKEDMFFIDVKVIPPRTLVNFDAFLYLPRNKRFVRYLKEGRYLSLEQAKRHAENSANHRMYLPKNHKAKFIQFFISNTINWEYMLFLNPQDIEEEAA